MEKKQANNFWGTSEKESGQNKQINSVWGVLTGDGSELWDSPAVFKRKIVGVSDKLRLFFYPKKFFLYRYIAKKMAKNLKNKRVVRVLDVGCGTGGSIIDLKRLLGSYADVHGIEVVALQIDIAKERLKKEAVPANIRWYDGGRFPFESEFFDVVYSSDVLGHVKNVPYFLDEITRVLNSDGVFAIFSESALGKHAYVRRYLFERGLNVDPHATFHISLYGKQTLRDLFQKAGLHVEIMRGLFWASFFVHPDEFYNVLQNQDKFLFFKYLNKILFFLKKKTHPVSTAFAELYGLCEALIIGKYIESQGYVLLGRKRHREKT